MREVFFLVGKILIEIFLYLFLLVRKEIIERCEFIFFLVWVLVILGWVGCIFFGSKEVVECGWVVI